MTSTDKPDHPESKTRRNWNVTELARMHSAEAMTELAGLMKCPNPCVSVAAIRTMLERAYGRMPSTVVFLSSRSAAEKEPDTLTVNIKRYSEEQSDGASGRHHDLPVVYGGWQGPRDLKRPGGSGMRTVRGKRAGLRSEPRLSDGTQADIPRAGPESRSGGEAAARTDGDDK